MDKTYDTRKPYSVSCWLWYPDRKIHLLSPIEDNAPKGKAVTLQEIVDHFESIHPGKEYVIHHNCVQIYSSFIPSTPTKHTNTKPKQPEQSEQLSLW